ncbi:hypothetical protein [Diplocloster modestus]|nr:hypothetical protein [Diplocloster modestus]
MNLDGGCAAFVKEGPQSRTLDIIGADVEGIMGRASREILAALLE